MEWQRIIALGLVMAALLWLLRPIAPAWFKKKTAGKPGACGGCSCSVAVKVRQASIKKRDEAV